MTHRDTSRAPGLYIVLGIAVVVRIAKLDPTGPEAGHHDLKAKRLFDHSVQ
jgi:hypothetical protein